MNILNAIFIAASEEPMVLFFLLFVAFIFFFIVHGFYFYVKYQVSLDKELMGDNYFDGGMTYNIICRQSLYVSAAMFPSFLKFIPLIDHKKFERLGGVIRFHLVVQELLFFLAIIPMMVCLVWGGAGAF